MPPVLGGRPRPEVWLAPPWGPGRLDEGLGGAGKGTGTPPRDADMDVSTGWVKPVPEKVGKELDVEASKRAVMDAVATGGRRAACATGDDGRGGSAAEATEEAGSAGDGGWCTKGLPVGGG